jgi:hypothetical protein
MVFYNISQVSNNKTRTCSYTQSVGRVCSDHFKELLIFNPNFNGQHNGLLQYQQESNIHKFLSLPSPSIQTNECFGNNNNIIPYLGNIEHQDGQIKSSYNKWVLFSQNEFLFILSKNFKGHFKIRSIHESRKQKMCKVL